MKDLVNPNHIQPAEVLKDESSGIEFAIFKFDDGIALAELNNWTSVTTVDKLRRVGHFMVFGGEVLIRVVPADFDNVERQYSNN